MSTPGYRKLFFPLLALAFCASMQNAHAVVLNWSTITWPAASLNNSLDVDPAKPGNDVTVAITGNTGQFQPSLTPPNPQTPAVTQTFEGGFGAFQPALELRLDYLNTAQIVTVTITFGANYTLGVSNVSLTLFDIDLNTWQDEIRSITALSTDGVTQIAPTITGLGSAVTLSGTGLNQVLDGIANVAETGAASGNGNATISFGATPLRSITFTYGSGPSSPADPSAQKIGISVIDFIAVVPEVNPAVASAVLCLLAIGLLHAKERASRRL
jgi:hypothetical protein